MLGSVGDDLYRDKVINSFKTNDFKSLLKIIPNMDTSRFFIVIYKKKEVTS